MPDEICHHGTCYHGITGRYKYKLTKNYDHATGIGGRERDLFYLAIDTAGTLTVRARYAWDGPSGPSIDTPSFMRGSLVHDALYQLMREKVLDYRQDRKPSDQLLRAICIADGMWRFRAWYVYRLVRLFGESRAKPPD